MPPGIHYGDKLSCADIVCPSANNDEINGDLAFTRVFMTERFFFPFRVCTCRRETSDGIIFHRWYGMLHIRLFEFYERDISFDKDVTVELDRP